ncbi:MAG: rRNA maturation RNase YbeY [Pseudopedobacter saltans]|uniref:Endoribonuclease YbeY n=1 Tax=Pseudopedobacter saltans TaxID=151895 RepID=A0A2W5HAR8_9SPHI|nr:MAG: rRNA maturation RNase YbeY [Pseudopedobacter saltans]
MKKVSFHYADKKLNLSNKTEVKESVEEIFQSEKIKLNHIDYIFCSDEYLLEINRQYLQHDFYTDIITFDLSENKNETIGEVYVSLDRIKDNALKLQQPLKNETLRVIFHGALHLCGYKDKTDKDSKLMRSKEDFYINKYLKNNKQ